MKLEEIIPEERGLVDEMRRRFKQKMSNELFEDDSLFQRFLRARNYDLDAAECMLKNHLNWRRVYELDIIDEYSPKEVLKKHLRVDFLGYDKGGTLVAYMDFGVIDTRGLLKSATRRDIQSHVIWLIEKNFKVKATEQTETTGKPANLQIACIFNFENLSYSTATHKQTIEAAMDLFKMYEANYPETLKYAFFINVSIIFTLAWSLIKPLVSGRMNKKIFMYGKDGWQSDMLNRMDADILPAFLGGKRTDPDGDPRCRSLLYFGGAVSESFYMDKNSSKPSSIPGSTTAKVNRLSKMELKFEVIISGSIIKWDYLVKDRDIAFSLLYKAKDDDDSEVKELVPKQRIEYDAGIYNCHETGIYILEFDNTYSWLHSKEIHYMLSITRPVEHKLEYEE